MRVIQGRPRILLGMIYSTLLRLIALVLVTVMLVVAATPAKAEAIEPLVIVAIATLAVAGILIIAYLIVANIEGDRRADEGRVIWLAQSLAGLGAVPGERGGHAAMQVVEVERLADVVEASAP